MARRDNIILDMKNNYQEIRRLRIKILDELNKVAGFELKPNKRGNQWLKIHKSFENIAGLAKQGSKKAAINNRLRMDASLD